MEISQTEEDKYGMISLLCVILKTKLVDTESGMMVTRDWRSGEDVVSKVQTFS